ncbi:Predicted dithiol-disulfide isomerase, DsbA family [Paenibacillus sp. 1_12]|uniref:DsbA family oxidoreductase n=1 Tax=Paenibacillus sp. 1_12 TaxID=1566278 RepID=UPI0008E4D4DE|nr:DsbA family oxidoreductase [Paenibacillus sp. 1_12]SFM10472.1 Predicted dithiol-disulfide isomerase, DsbA family [Paenibacillus sp. 1_12]
MKIEVWSDFSCPFCYIGKRQLELAIEQFNYRTDVEVEFKSFELVPNAERYVDYNVNEILSKKYGITLEQVQSNNQSLTERASTLGLEYHIDTMKLTNTFDAHRLAQMATQYGKKMEMVERLFKATFTESKHLGDHETLADLAEEVGLDRNEVLEMLKTLNYTQEVRLDEKEAQEIGVRGVPFFVIDRKYALSGAQSNEVFLQALTKAYQASHPFTIISENDNGSSCNDGSCSI